MHCVADGGPRPSSTPGVRRLGFDPVEVERFRAKREVEKTASQAAAAIRAAAVAERRRVWEERLSRRRAWSEAHREQIEREGVVRRGEGLMARFPIEPLFAMALGDPILRLSRTMGVDNGQMRRACREGLTWLSADRWAVALGFHPAEVWGQAWWSLD